MHSFIRQLASHYQIELSDRPCGGHDLNQPVWDGKTLATCWLDAVYDAEGENILQHNYKFLTDHELLHEICHWIVAEPEQRDLPEYGLGAFVFKCYDFFDQCPSVVDKEEGNIQEYAVQFLERHLAQIHDIAFGLGAEPDWSKAIESWDNYLSFKIRQALEVEGWDRQMFLGYLRFQNLLPNLPLTFSYKALS